ncbi:MAG: hypothetical protein FWC49_05425 [Proteobacteria bacterium]|nr:hypothetical protein [Pseudomonadota bacterium]
MGGKADVVLPNNNRYQIKAAQILPGHPVIIGRKTGKPIFYLYFFNTLGNSEIPEFRNTSTSQAHNVVFVAVAFAAPASFSASTVVNVRYSDNRISGQMQSGIRPPAAQTPWLEPLGATVRPETEPSDI